MSKRIKATIVDVAGPTNVQTIAEIHRKLLQGLQQNHAVELHLDSSADIDLTFVQLIESARQSAATENKIVALSAPAEADLREVLQRGGFVATAADRAFWLHEAVGN
jgi:hypothetical protein